MNRFLSSVKTRVVDPLQRLLSVHPKFVVPLASLALGYTTAGEYTTHGKDFDPTDDLTVQRNLWGGHLAIGGSHTKSLYYNAMLFVRINLPLGVFIGIRWAGKDKSKKEFFHGGFGHKLNGDFAMTFRFQSDDSAAGGTYGPNVGQAAGWSAGTK